MGKEPIFIVFYKIFPLITIVNLEPFHWHKILFFFGGGGLKLKKIWRLKHVYNAYNLYDSLELYTCSTTLNSNYTICRFLANKFKDLGLYGNSILEASEVSSVDIILIIEGNGEKWVTSSGDLK